MGGLGGSGPSPLGCRRFVMAPLWGVAAPVVRYNGAIRRSLTGGRPAPEGRRTTKLEVPILRKRVRNVRLVLWLLMVGSFFVASRWEGYPVMEGLLFFAGCMLAAGATIGRLWCTLYIGGYKTTKLITGGPYSLCRNPLYFLSGVGLVGLGFSTGTFTFPLLLALVYAITNITVIRSEESFLGELHGEAYQAYKGAVPRF